MLEVKHACENMFQMRHNITREIWIASHSTKEITALAMFTNVTGSNVIKSLIDNKSLLPKAL